MIIAAHPELEQDLARVCQDLAGRCQYLEMRVEESESSDLSFQGADLESLLEGLGGSERRSEDNPKRRGRAALPSAVLPSCATM